MGQRLRTFADTFRHFQENFWYEAGVCTDLRIDWMAVTGERSSIELPRLVRRVRVPVVLRVTMVNPEPELANFNPDWPREAEHSMQKWNAFFKKNAPLARVSGELFTYKFTTTPSMHGFCLNDRYFYISHTEQHGPHTDVDQDDGYEFFQMGEERDGQLLAFTSLFHDRLDCRIWPTKRYPEFGDWVKIHITRAIEGDSSGFEELVNLVLGAWGMNQLRRGESPETVYSQQRQTREALQVDPWLALDWLTGQSLTGRHAEIISAVANEARPRLQSSTQEIGSQMTGLGADPRYRETNETADAHKTRVRGEPDADSSGGTKNLTGPRPRSRMTVAQANDEAMKLARKMKAGFFELSQRQQAELIGCSWATWKNTPFYQTAQAKRQLRKPTKPQSPQTSSFTSGREAVTGEGKKDEVLEQLIAEHEADMEPSPLEPDPADRPRKVHSRKRL